MRKQQLFDDICQKLAAADLYYGHGVIDEQDEAMLILMSIFDQTVDEVLSSGNDIVSNQNLEKSNQIVQTRITKQLPIAYILGYVYFAELKFYCDERALVPRSPIAELILDQFENQNQVVNTNKILDICCGGGCIGIAAAYHLDSDLVDLADISDRALELADKNIGFHNLSSKVNTVCSDLFFNVSGKYDLILSNPPYVSEAEYQELPKEYKLEPKLGLITELDGLRIPLQILVQTPDFLEEDGCLILEVGYSDELLDDSFPEVDFNWLEFTHGGQGVCIFSRDELLRYRKYFNSYLERQNVV